MSSHLCLALLALFALTAASDPECEELTKTLEDRTKVLGKWVLYAGTSDCEDKLPALKSIKSSWMELLAVPEGDMVIYYGDKLDGKCYHGSANTTFDGHVTKATFYFNSSSHEHSGNHLVSCSECVFWLDWKEGQGCRSLYLFTKTGGLDEADQVIFKKQLECLNFNLDVHYGDSTDLCPYEKVESIVLKTEEQ